MNKFSSPIFIMVLLSSAVFLTNCTKTNSPLGSSGQSSPNLSEWGNEGSGNSNGGSENNQAPKPPPVIMNPAIDAKYKFSNLNDYCTKLNTYATSSASGRGDKILGCWVLQSVTLPTAGATVQANVCNFTDETEAQYSTCGIYIFDHYRTRNSLGCGIVASIKGTSVKTFKVFGDLGFSNINNSWAGADGLFSSLPSLEGFSSSFDAITKTIISEGQQDDGGGVLFQNEILTFRRLNPAPNSEDSIIATNMKINSCALPYK